MSSAGSAASVAANLVTCAIGEETVVSIRWPASVNSLVGLAPTEELVSRKGNDGRRPEHADRANLPQRAGCGKNTRRNRRLRPEGRVDGIQCRTKRPHNRTSIPQRRGVSDGLRIGVIREYMARKLFSKADEESIDIVDRAIEDLRNWVPQSWIQGRKALCSMPASRGTRRSS